MKPENVNIMQGVEHVYRKCPVCGEWGWVKRHEREVCVFCLEEIPSEYLTQKGGMVAYNMEERDK